MTTDYLLGHLESISALQAERTMRAVEAGNPTEELFDRLRRDLEEYDREVSESAGAAGKKVGGIRVNGVVVSLDEAKARIAAKLGAGFSVN